MMKITDINIKTICTATDGSETYHEVSVTLDDMLKLNNIRVTQTSYDTGIRFPFMRNFEGNEVLAYTLLDSGLKAMVMEAIRKELEK